MLRKRPHDCRARRCRELFLRTKRVCRPPHQEFSDRRRRYGHDAMRAAHITAADIEPRREHLLDAEIVEADGRADDIDEVAASRRFDARRQFTHDLRSGRNLTDGFLFHAQPDQDGRHQEAKPE